MIIERIVTNIEEMEKEEIAKRHMEKVYLESARFSETNSKSDNRSWQRNWDSLKKPRDLMAGDVLYMDDKNMIIVDVLSDDLLVISHAV